MHRTQRSFSFVFNHGSADARTPLSREAGEVGAYRRLGALIREHQDRRSSLTAMREYLRSDIPGREDILRSRCYFRL
jgi:hypothetical protein